MDHPLWLTTHLSFFEPQLLATTSHFIPPAFTEITRYPLATGGKRFRPLLCFAAAEALGAPPFKTARSAALALELVHTYSLVHDDLPCMDNDALRRGKPTLHILHGDAVAVLAGDALLTEAFDLLTHYPPETALPLIKTLSQAAGGQGMVAGQYLDITATPDITETALLQLHRAKTGALIRAACIMGGITAGATSAQLSALSEAGDAIGLAFQLQDDVLDSDQDAKESGPPSFIKLLGLEKTKARAGEELSRALTAIQTLPNPTHLAALARFTVERAV
jgi:geranylgeranyl diphosphate synthase type II